VRETAGEEAYVTAAAVVSMTRSEGGIRRHGEATEESDRGKGRN